MAREILSMDLHCDSCAKKVRKAVRKVPGVKSVSASVETGMVVVEGTADAATVRARLEARLGRPVTVVSDGVEEGESSAATGADVGVRASSPPRRAPDQPAAPAKPIVLEMDLHCGTCARKVEKFVKKIPGVETVTTDVESRLVEVTGTADASAVATSIENRTRRSATVVSDPGRTGLPVNGHEQRRAAPADSEPAPAQPPFQPYAPADSYYPGPGGEDYYSVQNWASPYQPPEGYYPSGQGEEVYGVQQDWAPPPYPSLEGYYPGQGGEMYGDQQWGTPYAPQESYYSGARGGDAYGQQRSDENADSTCSVQ